MRDKSFLFYHEGRRLEVVFLSQSAIAVSMFKKSWHFYTRKGIAKFIRNCWKRNKEAKRRIDCRVEIGLSISQVYMNPFKSVKENNYKTIGIDLSNLTKNEARKSLKDVEIQLDEAITEELMHLRHLYENKVLRKEVKVLARWKNYVNKFANTKNKGKYLGYKTIIADLPHFLYMEGVLRYYWILSKGDEINLDAVMNKDYEKMESDIKSFSEKINSNDFSEVMKGMLEFDYFRLSGYLHLLSKHMAMSIVHSNYVSLEDMMKWNSQKFMEEYEKAVRNLGFHPLITVRAENGAFVYSKTIKHINDMIKSEKNSGKK